MTTLSEIERPLALFTQGIIERIPVFHDTEQRHAINSSHLCELFLPQRIDHFESSRNNEELYRWMVMQQLAFRRYDTLTFSIETAREQNAYLAAQPNPYAHRLTDLELFYRHFPIPHLASYMFFAIEEARVAQLMVAEFPGSARLRTSYRRYRTESVSPAAGSEFSSLLDFESALQNPDEIPSLYRELVAPIYESNATVYASAKATINCYIEFFSELRTSTEPSEEDGLTAQLELPTLQRAARLEEWQQELSEIDAELMAMEFEANAEATHADSSEALDGETRETGVDIKQERDQLQRRIDMEKSLLGAYERHQIVDRPHYRYDEWDYLNQSWRKCVVLRLRNP